jgi:hypothetical protein
MIYVGHVTEALKRTKFARHYALGDTEKMALAALLSEWQAGRNESFTHEAAAKFLEQLRDSTPSLFQNRPAAEKELPKLPVDPVSGQAPPNPFSKATFNLSEQMWLREHEPALADYLKATADTGATYSYLAKQRAEKDARDKIRAIEYGEKQHAENENPYRGGNLAAKSEFRRTHGDLVADFWKREGTEPVSLPWLPGKDGKPNLTGMSILAKRSPDLRQLVDRSMGTLKDWASESLLESEKEQAASQSRADVARQLLGTKT